LSSGDFAQGHNAALIFAPMGGSGFIAIL
jgi:hypothetical protein